MADPLTSVGTAVANQAIGALNTQAPANKDDFDRNYQRLILNHPELADRLNDPRVRAVFKAAIGDAVIKGNEKVLTEVVPELLKKINVTQIDLSMKDAQARIEAEADKAKQYYAGWLAQQQAQAQIDQARAKANLDANSSGAVAYERATGERASFWKIITVLADCFKEGSLDPLRKYVAEAQKPKSLSIQTTDASGVRAAPDNAYSMVNPKLDGAKTLPEIAVAARSGDPMGAVAGSPAGGGASSTTTADIRANGADATRAPSTPAADSSRKPRAIQFGNDPAPQPN